MSLPGSFSIRGGKIGQETTYEPHGLCCFSYKSPNLALLVMILNKTAHVSKTVLCPAYFSHAERKNSLVNCLFRFCSKHHQRGTPIRLLYQNDVTYCNGNQWRLASWSVMQETKPGRGRELTSEGMDLLILNIIYSTQIINIYTQFVCNKPITNVNWAFVYLPYLKSSYLCANKFCWGKINTFIINYIPVKSLSCLSESSLIPQALPWLVWLPANKILLG